MRRFLGRTGAVVSRGQDTSRTRSDQTPPEVHTSEPLDSFGRSSLSPVEAKREFEASSSSNQEELRPEDSVTLPSTAQKPLRQPSPDAASGGTTDTASTEVSSWKTGICIIRYLFFSRLQRVRSQQCGQFETDKPRSLNLQDSFTYGHRQLLEEPLMVGNVTERFKVNRQQEGAGENVTIDVKEFVLKQNYR